MTRVSEEACVVFLLLVGVDLVAASSHGRRDIVHVIVAFLLIVGGRRDLPLIRGAVVDLHLSELGPHVLKTYLVQADTTYLHFQMLVLPEIPSLIQLSVVSIFDGELLHRRILLSTFRFYLL